MTSPNEFLAMMKDAFEEAAFTETEVFLSDDENGVWQQIHDDDSGFVPCVMLGIAPNGSIRIVDNNGAYEDDEPWRR